jgi:hypothetical protein
MVTVCCALPFFHDMKNGAQHLSGWRQISGTVHNCRVHGQGRYGFLAV